MLVQESSDNLYKFQIFVFLVFTATNIYKPTYAMFAGKHGELFILELELTSSSFISVFPPSKKPRRQTEKVASELCHAEFMSANRANQPF